MKIVAAAAAAAARDAMLGNGKGDSQLCLQAVLMAASEAVNRTKEAGSGTCEQPPRHHDVNNTHAYTHTHIPVQVSEQHTERRCCTEEPTPYILLAA